MNRFGKYFFTLCLVMNLWNSFAQNSIKATDTTKALAAFSYDTLSKEAKQKTHTKDDLKNSLSTLYQQAQLELIQIDQLLEKQWCIKQMDKQIIQTKLQVLTQQLNALMNQGLDSLPWQKLKKKVTQHQAKLQNIWVIPGQFSSLFIIICGLFLGVVCLLALALKRIEQQKSFIQIQQEELQNQHTEIFTQKNQLATLSHKLTQSNTYKDKLIKELHHRVKNNLQNINSILNLQSDNPENAHAQALIQNMQNRIYLMALIYKLSQESEKYGYLDMQIYLLKLREYMLSLYDVSQKNVSWELDIDSIILDIDTATSIGLIVYELVSNAFGQAMIEKNQGNISIAFRRITEQRFELKILNKGLILNPEFKLDQLENIGLELVQCLLIEIEGSLLLDHQNGTQFTIYFKENTCPKFYKKDFKLQST